MARDWINPRRGENNQIKRDEERRCQGKKARLKVTRNETSFYERLTKVEYNNK